VLMSAASADHAVVVSRALAERMAEVRLIVVAAFAIEAPTH
jgi:hypothetical protein